VPAVQAVLLSTDILGGAPAAAGMWIDELSLTSSFTDAGVDAGPTDSGPAPRPLELEAACGCTSAGPAAALLAIAAALRRRRRPPP
jgi:MYXO-CTERM domain-containing protein